MDAWNKWKTMGLPISPLEDIGNIYIVIFTVACLLIGLGAVWIYQTVAVTPTSDQPQHHRTVTQTQTEELRRSTEARSGELRRRPEQKAAQPVDAHRSISDKPTELSKATAAQSGGTCEQLDEKSDEMANKAEKCYDPKDSTLVFVDVDDLDYCYEEFKSLKAKMSCGHGVTPSSLTNWCRHLLNEGNSSFSCGNCRAKWPYVEVRKMALLTLEEREEFEKTMAFNAAKDGLESKTCPHCNSSVTRKDESNLCVVCRMCSITRNQNYEFCWQCMMEWKGSRPRSDRCDNEGCTSVPLDTLRTCEEIVFKSVKGVSGCPSIRACPTCGRLLEHSSKKCKNLACPRCKVEFCFVCLKITKECQEAAPGSYFKMCSSGLAPRQTSIPEWRNKQ